MVGQSDTMDPAVVQTKLKQKAVPNMNALMDGDIEYFLEVPTWRRRNGELHHSPLVFSRFTRDNRPQCWKDTDSKVQNALPILGIECEEKVLRELAAEDEICQEELAQSTGPAWLVRVRIQLTS